MTITTRAGKGSALTHNELDANFNELYGASPVAPAGGMWVSDGVGGGEFIRVQGWGQYSDTDVTVGSPSQTLVSGVRTQFTIDGGATTIEKLPSDATAPLWNVSTNKIQPIATFDTYNFRLGYAAQNYSGTSPYILMELDIGGALGTIWNRTYPLLKGGSEQFVEAAFPVFAGSTFLANGGELYLTYVGTANCDIYASQILIIRESKNYV